MDVHSQDDQGVYGSFVVSAVPGGDHALTLAGDGVPDGLSVGVEVLDSRSIVVDGQDVEEITRAAARGVPCRVSRLPIRSRDSTVAATQGNPTMSTPTAPALVVTPTPADPLTDFSPEQRDRRASGHGRDDGRDPREHGAGRRHAARGHHPRAVRARGHPARDCARPGG